MEPAPEVSVIIPTYNRANLLRETIQSALDQTFQDFEILVVDDGSTDNTRDLVLSLANPKIRYIYQQNLGVSAAYNTGIRNSRGRYIAFLDSDDLWLPEKLERQIQAMRCAKEAGVIYSDTYFLANGDSPISKTQFQLLPWPPPRGKVLDKIVERNFPQTSTLLIRREVFNKVGLFDEKISHCEDYDLLFRIAGQFEFEVVPAPLSKYRQHGIQLSRDSECMLAGRIMFLKKALQASFIDRKIAKKLRAALSDNHFLYGMVFIRKGNLIRGMKALEESARADAWRIFPSSLSLTKRTLNYPFRLFKTRVRLSN